MDLIDRQAAIDTLVKLTTCNGVRELFEYVQEHHLSDMWSGGIVDAIDAVIGVPSAQPERKTGRWIDDNCSECGQYVYHGDVRNFCPNCGADMRGEQDE